jgi:hypothetical protein
MHPTADTTDFIFGHRSGRPGDAGRWAANLNLQIMLGIMPPDVL